MPEVSELLDNDLEQFKSDLDDAEGIAGIGGRAPFEDFESFAALEGRGAEMMELLGQRYGVDLKSAVPVKVEEMDGTPNSPGEGKIKVSLFATNVEDVYIGKYEYADGSVGWTIQALEVEE